MKDIPEKLHDSENLHDEARIEAWLARMHPPPPTDLMERILFAARQTPQRQIQSFGEWLRELFADCHLPSPSYALAAMLAVGLGLGMLTPAPSSETDSLLWTSADEEILP